MDWAGSRLPLAAIEQGRIEVVRWLYARNVYSITPWNSNTLRHAARGGHMRMVEWLVAHSPLAVAAYRTRNVYDHDDLSCRHCGEMCTERHKATYQLLARIKQTTTLSDSGA